MREKNYRYNRPLIIKRTIMYQTVKQIRVRYGETDQMGYVYYGNYALYLEVARTEMLRDLGFNYKSFEEQGMIMPVASMEIKYIRPARYDDLLSIKTIIKELPGQKIIFDYEIYNEQDKLLNVSKVKLAFVSAATGKLHDPPKKFIEAIAHHFDTENISK